MKARNLAADPRVVVHLESGEDVLIVRGTAKDLGTPAQVPDAVAALSAKYTGEDDRQYLPDADPDFERGLRHQPAVGDDVALGELALSHSIGGCLGGAPLSYCCVGRGRRPERPSTACSIPMTFRSTSSRYNRPATI